MESNLRPWTKRLLTGLASLILLAAVAGFTYEQWGRSHDKKILPPRVGQSVDIGGRSINIYCSGEGSPAAILEAPGGPGYGWVLVQPKIAAFTRACWYDRAGEGWSDPPNKPRTSDTITDDLHEVLRHAGIPPPYILVGASIGGEYVRVFTGKFPTEVAGVVLVDSSSPDQHEPPSMTNPVNRMPAFERRFLCAALPTMIRFGIIRLMLRSASQSAPRRLSPGQQPIFRALNSQPMAFETADAEACEGTDGGAVVPVGGTGNPKRDNAVRSAGNLGDRPLIVLTAGLSFAPPNNPVAAQEAADFHKIWVSQLQNDLAHLSTRGKQIIVANSDHNIEFWAPDAVANAVQEVVTRIRSDTKHLPF